MGPKSVLNLQKLSTDSFVFDQMWRRSEHCFGWRMGPKRVLNLQTLKADSVVVDQTRRGLRTFLLEREWDPQVFWIFRSLIQIRLFWSDVERIQNTFLEQEWDPKVFWIFRSLSTYSFVFDQMWRGFRTLLLNKNGTHKCSESWEA